LGTPNALDSIHKGWWRFGLFVPEELLGDFQNLAIYLTVLQELRICQVICSGSMTNPNPQERPVLLSAGMLTFQHVVPPKATSKINSAGSDKPGQCRVRRRKMKCLWT
jgi:hypothetical protein